MSDRTQHVAEDLASIVDYLSRVMQAVEEGNVHYLHDKAGQLANAARRLQLDLSAPPKQGEYTLPVDPNVRFDPARVQQLVQRYASHYRTGRELYPKPVDDAVRRRLAADVEEILGGGR